MTCDKNKLPGAEELKELLQETDAEREARHLECFIDAAAESVADKMEGLLAAERLLAEIAPENNYMSTGEACKQLECSLIMLYTMLSRTGGKIAMVIDGTPLIDRPTLIEVKRALEAAK
jgi:hypothetical protein